MLCKTEDQRKIFDRIGHHVDTLSYFPWKLWFSVSWHYARQNLLRNGAYKMPYETPEEREDREAEESRRNARAYWDAKRATAIREMTERNASQREAEMLELDRAISEQTS